MKLTATEKAEMAALQVIVWAREVRRPVTRRMIDVILSRDADKVWGDANVRTVRREVRKLASDRADVQIALTDREEYQLRRQMFSHWSRDRLLKLWGEISDENDSRGRDKNFVRALSAALRATAPTSLRGLCVR